jgi:hypothetical protein
VNEEARRPRRSSLPPERDQHATAFTLILSDLVTRVPGARAAALVDVEGETVDYWGLLPPFDVKVAAAQWRVLVDEIRERGPLAGSTFVALRAARASYHVHVLPEGYALVIVFSRAAGFGGWRRAVAACCLALAGEASWSARDLRSPRWYWARVVTDARGRPAALGSPPNLRAIDVLGAVVGGLERRERGWRVRVADGVDATLVREAGGNWYVDEPTALRELPAKPEPQSR